jgi:hypothetical protein
MKEKTHPSKASTFARLLRSVLKQSQAMSIVINLMKERYPDYVVDRPVDLHHKISMVDSNVSAVIDQGGLISNEHFDDMRLRSRLSPNEEFE